MPKSIQARNHIRASAGTHSLDKTLLLDIDREECALVQSMELRGSSSNVADLESTDPRWMNVSTRPVVLESEPSTERIRMSHQHQAAPSRAGTRLQPKILKTSAFEVGRLSMTWLCSVDPIITCRSRRSDFHLTCSLSLLQPVQAIRQETNLHHSIGL